MLIRSRNFGLLGAAGGCFGLDLGAIWGSIFAPEARSAILIKNSTAPTQEHDFQGSGGGPKRAQNGSENDIRRKPRSEAVLGPFRPSFWALLGGPGRAKTEPETAPKAGANLEHF